MMLIRLSLCLLALIAVSGVGAQTLTTNDEGEQIIVYPDGSWRYFNQAPAEAEPEAKPTSIEDETYTKPELSAEAEAQARILTRRRVDALQKQLRKDESDLAKLKEREVKERKRLEKLRSDRDAVNRDEVDIASRRLQAVRREVEEAETALAKASADALALETTLPMTRSQRKRFIAERDLTNVSADLSDLPSGDDAAPYETPTSSNRKRKADLESDFLAYDQTRDPKVNPPEVDCTIAYEGVDEFTQRKQRELAPALLFAYTRPELKQYMGSEALVTANGRLLRSGGYVVLAIDFTIRSQFANREFGALPKGSQLTLRFIDGSTMILRNQKLSQGRFDPVDKVYTYNATYPLPGKQQKRLEKQLLDQVRVMWGTGFEDYPIYEVDFFQRQLKCI